MYLPPPAHLCLPHFSFCPPPSSPAPCAPLSMCSALGSSFGHPCPPAAPFHVPLPHFKVWVLPCSSLLGGCNMCPVPSLPGGGGGVSPHTRPSVSPLCSASAQVRDFSMCPQGPASLGTPGPEANKQGCHRGGLGVCPGPGVPLPSPHHGGPSEHSQGHPRCTLPHTQDPSVQPHAGCRVSPGAPAQPPHRDPRLHPRTDGGLLHPCTPGAAPHPLAGNHAKAGSRVSPCAPAPPTRDPLRSRPPPHPPRRPYPCGSACAP